MVNVSFIDCEYHGNSAFFYYEMNEISLEIIQLKIKVLKFHEHPFYMWSANLSISKSDIRNISLHDDMILFNFYDKCQFNISESFISDLNGPDDTVSGGLMSIESDCIISIREVVFEKIYNSFEWMNIYAEQNNTLYLEDLTFSKVLNKYSRGFKIDILSKNKIFFRGSFTIKDDGNFKL